MTKKYKIFLFVILFCPNLANAWSGHDYEKNSPIEIGSGNLVREGSIIDFFDDGDGKYHNGKVLIMQSISGGTEITVEDFTIKKQRTFIMR
jgi:hypothetical protein